MDPRLFGVWNSDEKDDDTRNSIGSVTMTFTHDGALIYDIHENNKIQRINLVYKIDGDMIVSDQPSHPKEQVTIYRLENDNTLILEFENMKTKFIKEKK